MDTSISHETAVKHYKWSKRRMKMAPYMFVSPFFIVFAVFMAFPIVFSLILSLNQWNGIRPMKFVGVDNFLFILRANLFWKTLGNTFAILILGALPSHLIALSFAYMLNQSYMKFKNLFKSILFMPYITSLVAIALVFSIFYGYHTGFLNYMLKFIAPILNEIGFAIKMPVEWLKGELTWVSIAILSMWRWTGWNAIIYMAGMQGIDSSIYEAARIDGASGWQIFFRITIPLLKPVIFFGSTMSIIGGMQSFDDPVVLLGIGGGAANAFMGMTSSIYIYNNAFRWNSFGLAAAASYVLFVIIMILTWINTKVFKEK